MLADSFVYIAYIQDTQYPWNLSLASGQCILRNKEHIKQKSTCSVAVY